MYCMCPPQQGQVVVSVVGGDGLDVGSQRIDAALIFENLPNPSSQDVIAEVSLGLMQKLTEHADQTLFHLPVSILQKTQLLLRCMPGLSHLT